MIFEDCLVWDLEEFRIQACLDYTAKGLFDSVAAKVKRRPAWTLPHVISFGESVVEVFFYGLGRGIGFRAASFPAEVDNHDAEPQYPRIPMTNVPF